MQDVKQKGHPVDDLVGGHLPKHNLEGALPEVQQHHRNINYLKTQNKPVVVREVGLSHLCLRVVVQVLQLIRLEVVGVEGAVLCDALLEVASEQGYVFGFEDDIQECFLFWFVPLMGTSFVALSLGDVLAVFVNMSIVGVLVHFPEGTVIRR